MRVFVTFSIVNLVFPPFPAILPIALDKWSPFRGFTAKTQEVQFAAGEKKGNNMRVVSEQTEVQSYRL